MKPRKTQLSTTPTPEALAELRLGDIVYLNGLMYTAREDVYMARSRIARTPTGSRPIKGGRPSVGKKSWWRSKR